MSLRLPQHYIVLLYLFKQSDKTVNTAVYEYSRNPSLLDPIHRGRISFTYDKKKLRPYRYEQKSGNSFRFHRDKDAIKLLQEATLIIITPDDRPANVNEYLEFFASKGIDTPKIFRICTRCFKEYRKLTSVTDLDAFTLYNKDICKNCAVFEIQEEYNRRGIPITSSSRKYYNELLKKYKSVDAVVESLWKPIPNDESKSTSLFDVVEADTKSHAIDIRKFVETSGEKSNFDKDIIDLWYKLGIKQFLPVQQIAMNQGLLNYKDLLVVAGTSSGKTFVGEIAGLHNWKRRDTKFVFATPLVALSNQKYEDFKRKYSKIGARVSLRVGMSKIDVGEEEKIYPNSNFAKSDIIVATFEALDWIFRSGQWKNIGEIGTFVIDEVQLLGDEERGITVDGIITRVRTLFPKCQIICLSATIGNPLGLAKELGLELVSYLNRPIPLERHIMMVKNDEERVNTMIELVSQESKILSKTNHKGQSLVFTSTRRRVQELSSIFKAAGLKSAYYHSGMTYLNRKKIESKFEQGQLDVVTTTAALGAGADFPVSLVLFEKPAMGARWITNAEYHQMSGRAGRYGFHDRGKAIMIVIPGEKIYMSQEKTGEQVAFDILTGDIEEIDGDVDQEQEMDQLLAIISAAHPISESKLIEYHKSMFYQTTTLSKLLSELIKKGLIVKSGDIFRVSSLGRAISSSFLLPTFGYEIAKRTLKDDIVDIAIEIAPADIVYISSKLHARLEQAMKTNLPRRFLSDAILDIILGSGLNPKTLPAFVIDKIKLWNRTFFDCSCKDNPYCIHPIQKLSRLILELRLEGLSLSQINYELAQRYDFFVYQGDLLTWLDQIIHAIRAISRLAKATKRDNIVESTKTLAKAIESANKTLYPLENKILSVNISLKGNDKPKNLKRSKKRSIMKKHSPRKRL